MTSDGTRRDDLRRSPRVPPGGRPRRGGELGPGPRGAGGGAGPGSARGRGGTADGPWNEPDQAERAQDGSGHAPDAGVEKRRSTRDLSPQVLSPQHLSELLWAADGINRKPAPGADPRESGSRTSPSPLGKYPVDIYAVLKEGVYLYRPAEHDLIPVLSGDHRKDMGIQGFVGVAPLTLLFVADLARFNSTRMPVEEQILESHVEAGCQARERVSVLRVRGARRDGPGLGPQGESGRADESPTRAEDRRRPDDRLPRPEIRAHRDMIPHGGRLQGRAQGTS